MPSLSGGTAYVDVALGKTSDFAKGITQAGERGADEAKRSFLSRVGDLAIGGALANGLTAGISSAFQFGKGAVFDFNSQLQQADIGFTTMLGSAGKSKAFLDDLQDFAKTTPFEFGALVSNAQNMMGMGIAAKDVIPDLRALGDSVASIGGSAQQVDSVTLAFDQMAAKGTLDMGNMNQLMQNGVPSALKVLAAHYKVTTGEMITMISTGKVQASEALPALVQGIEKGTDATAALGGMMDKQSRTMAGALSNIKDSATQAIAGAFKPAFDAASTSAQGLATFLGSDVITSASKKINSGLTSMFGGVRHTFEQVRTGWKDTELVLTGGGTPLQRLGSRIHDFTGLVGDIGVGFKHANDYGGPAGSVMEGIGQKAKFAYEKMQPLAGEAFGKIKDAAASAGPIIKELFLDKIATIKTIIGDAIPIVENIAHTMGPVLGDVLRSAGNLLTQHVLPAFMRVSQFVQQKVLPIVADFVAFAVQRIMPVFREIGEVIAQKVMPIIGKLADLFVQKVLPALLPLIRDGFGFLKTVIAELAPIVADLVHWFAEYVLPVLAHLAEFLVGTLIPFVAQVADVLISILRPAFEIVVAIVRDVVIPAIKIVVGVFLGLYDTGVWISTGIIKAVQGIGKIFGWVKDEITAAAGWVREKWDGLLSFFKDVPGKLAAAGRGMWDWIKDSFRGAINVVIRWWDGLKFTMPRVHIPGTNTDVGGATIGVPQIRELASGGLVLPRPGGSIVRVAEAGEPEIVAPQRILQDAFAAVLAAQAPRRDGPAAVFQYFGTQHPSQELQAQMMRKVAQVVGA